MKTINDIYNDILEDKVTLIINEIEDGVRDVILNGNRSIIIEDYYKKPENVRNIVEERLSEAKYDFMRGEFGTDMFDSLYIKCR